MNIRQYIKWSTAIAVFAALTGPAHANNCDDYSPLRLTLGDAYWELHNPADDSLNTIKTTKGLLALIDNKHIGSGTGVRVHCFGKEHGRSQAQIKFDLEDVTRVETLNGNVQINAWEDSSRKTASATIDLPAAGRWVVKPDGKIVSNHLFRRMGNPINTGFPINRPYIYATGTEETPLPDNIGNLLDFPNRAGSYVVEIETTVERVKSGIAITQVFYTNGFRSEWVTWQLDT